MKIKAYILFFLVSSLLFLPSCKNLFRYTDAREIPVDADSRVKKNMEEGRGMTIFSNEKSGGVFDFASSNELWRASIEVLDFVSFTNASYSGGILITDWFSGNVSAENNNQRDLKITIRFLTNEIRADALNIKIFYKNCKSVTNCMITEKETSLKNELRKEILKKAAVYKKNFNVKNFKKYDYPEIARD